MFRIEFTNKNIDTILLTSNDWNFINFKKPELIEFMDKAIGKNKSLMFLNDLSSYFYDYDNDFEHGQIIISNDDYTIFSYNPSNEYTTFDIEA